MARTTASADRELIVSLRSRWNEPEGRSGVALVLEAIAKGRPLDRLPLGRIDGRVDLRGFPFPQAREAGSRPVGRFMLVNLSGGLVAKEVVLEQVDLSHAELGNVAFIGGRFADVLMTGVSARGARFLEMTMTGISLRAADLRGSAFGRDLLESVDFSGSDLRGASPGGTYRDCDLRGAKLDGIRFLGVTLERCRFGGRLRDVTFDALAHDGPPARLVDVDFSEATFEFVGFSHHSLDRVTLPSQADLHVVRHYRCVLERWLARLEASTDPADVRLRRHVAYLRDGTVPGQDVGCLEERMLASIPGGVAGSLALIREFERECQAAPS